MYLESDRDGYCWPHLSTLTIRYVLYNDEHCKIKRNKNNARIQ